MWRSTVAPIRPKSTQQSAACVVQSARWSGAAGTLAAMMARERVHPTNDQRSNGGSVAAMRAPSRRKPVTPMAARSARIPSAMLLRSSLGGWPRRRRHAIQAIPVRKASPAHSSRNENTRYVGPTRNGTILSWTKTRQVPMKSPRKP